MSDVPELPQPQMTKEKYLSIQLKLTQIAVAASSLDLDGFLKQISQAETVGPILDPTMYHKAQANLQVIKRMAESLVPVKATANEMMKTLMTQGPPPTGMV